MKDIKNSTIAQLENNNWLPLTDSDSSSYLIRTVHELRSQKIGAFEVEDFRIMIGQGIGMKFLVPEAIHVLSKNILAEGDFYEGDLLKSVLTSAPDYWKTHQEQWKKVCDIFDSNIHVLKEDDTTDEIRNGWFIAYEKFKQINE